MICGKETARDTVGFARFGSAVLIAIAVAVIAPEPVEAYEVLEHAGYWLILDRPGQHHLTTLECSMPPGSAEETLIAHSAEKLWNWDEASEDKLSVGSRACTWMGATHGDGYNDVYYGPGRADAVVIKTYDILSVSDCFDNNFDWGSDGCRVVIDETDVRFSEAPSLYTDWRFDDDQCAEVPSDDDMHFLHTTNHELGHVLGQQHVSQDDPPSVMNADMPYCGAFHLNVHPDDLAFARRAYPVAGGESVDLAVNSWERSQITLLDGSKFYTSWGHHVSGSQRSTSLDAWLFEGCPGESYEFEYSIANRGTEKIIYDRYFIYSSNNYITTWFDNVIDAEYDRVKSPGARWGFYDGRVRTLTVPNLGADTLWYQGVRVDVTSHSSQSLFSNDYSYFDRIRIKDCS